MRQRDTGHALYCCISLEYICILLVYLNGCHLLTLLKLRLASLQDNQGLLSELQELSMCCKVLLEEMRLSLPEARSFELFSSG